MLELLCRTTSPFVGSSRSSRRGLPGRSSSQEGSWRRQSEEKKAAAFHSRFVRAVSSHDVATVERLVRNITTWENRNAFDKLKLLACASNRHNRRSEESCSSFTSDVAHTRCISIATMTAAIEFVCQQETVDHAQQLLEVAPKAFSPSEASTMDLSRALWLAASHGHAALVQQIMQLASTTQAAGSTTRVLVDVNYESKAIEESAEAASSALHQACHHGHVEVVDVLLKNDATNINIRDAQGCATPLHYAVRRGQFSVVQRLLEDPNLEINARDNFDRTPLQYAAVMADLAVVKALVQHSDIDLNEVNSHQNTTIAHVVASIYQKQQAEQEVLRFTWSGDDHQRKQEVARMGEVLDFLISLPQLDINAQHPETGDTILHMACRNDWKTTQQTLVQIPALVDWSLTNDAGKHALELVQDSFKRQKLALQLSRQVQRSVDDTVQVIQNEIHRQEKVLVTEEQTIQTLSETTGSFHAYDEFASLVLMGDALNVVSLWLMLDTPERSSANEDWQNHIHENNQMELN